jgi:hypothetical protein
LIFLSIYSIKMAAPINVCPICNVSLSETPIFMCSNMHVFCADCVSVWLESESYLSNYCPEPYCECRIECGDSNHMEIE